MIADYQIRQWLARYLQGVVSLDQFEDWLVERSWNMHRDSNEAAQKLASAIELRLAEYSSAHLNDEQLRSQLLPLATNYNATVNFGKSEAMSAFSSDSQNSFATPRVFVVVQGEPIFQQLADTQRAAVSL